MQPSNALAPDIKRMTADASRASDRDEGDPAIRVWLICVAMLVALMVTIGGATRLTGSGLSITEWQPIVGTIPPLSDADWQAAFQKYKEIPQYREVNRGMSLEAFKGIFWWEWGHRFLGRIVGLAFALPLAVFWIAGRIDARLRPRLLGLLALGGLQGAMGWYMVKSGLVDRVSVSQYRLALHLGLAFILLGLLVWTALAVPRPDGPQPRRAPASKAASWLLGLIYVQVLLGALVAGLKAGLTHNTWPLMDGQLVPSGLFLQHPWLINLFENPTTVQFNHRMMAYTILAAAIWHAVTLWRNGPPHMVRSAVVLALICILQAILGIWTLLAWVPLWLGLVHQAGAVLLFTAAVVHLSRTHAPA